MYPGRYVVQSVFTHSGEQIVSSSTYRLHNIAGTYVGKDNPITIVRTQKNFPATEEAGSAFNILILLQEIQEEVTICL